MNDRPFAFNSFVDFETVLADCGGAMAITVENVVGTWIEVSTEENNTVMEETMVFNGDGTLTWSEGPRGGAVVESGVAEWTLVGNLIHVTGTEANDSWLDVMAITGNNGIKVYTEESNWNSDLTTLNDVPEGEIWTSGMEKQQLF